jgi:RNA recognition motif-containing protein
MGKGLAVTRTKRKKKLLCGRRFISIFATQKKRKFPFPYILNFYKKVVMNKWNINIPQEPSTCLVLIKNISPETKEATIKDFFSFCGVIKEFEIKLDSTDEQHQIAIVYFEKESAAKTATLLSQGNEMLFV